MGFLSKLFGKTESKKESEYKCPKCGAVLKNVGELNLKEMIKSSLLLDPEMLKNIEVQCWKCGNNTTAADLVAALSK